MTIDDLPTPLWFMLAMLSVWLLWWSTRRISASRRRHRRNIRNARRVFDKLATFQGAHRGAQVITYLRQLSPYVFEEVVLEAFHRKGYRIRRNASYSGDGGLDGRIYDAAGRLTLIQCKRYRGPIQAAHVRAFVSLVEEHSAAGYFVHTGKTSFRLLKATQRITFISGASLVSLFEPPAATKHSFSHTF